MIVSEFSRMTLAVVLLSALAGCGDGGVQEVKEWMETVKRQTKVAVPKLSEPKKFTPFSYAGKNAVDPFNPVKLSVAFAKQQPNTGNSFKPDLDRRREPLESYPLDSIKMVGTLEKPGLSYALLQVDRAIYQAKVGNYVGQNFGMITKVTDTQVELKEIVQDAAGDWVERKSTLELQETKK
jgi:type IV pilus assembly protein PilP